MSGKRLHAAVGTLLGFFLYLAAPATMAEGLPQWVLEPPQDNALSIYGVGEGSTLELARKNALNNIAGKISTRIKSASVSRTQAASGGVSRNFRESVETFVQEVKLSGYEVRQTDLYGGRYFTLVEMSRDAFVEDTRLVLQEIDKSIDRRVAAAADDKLRYFLSCQASQDDVERARFLSLVLNSTDPFFDAEATLARYSDFQAGCQRAVSSLRFAVKTAPEFAAIGRAITQELGVETVPPGSAADATLRLASDINHSEMFGGKNAQVDLVITVLDRARKEVARQQYRLNGTSMVSQDAAVSQAVSLFLKERDAKQLLVDLGVR